MRATGACGVGGLAILAGVTFVCRCCGHRAVAGALREPPGFVMRCEHCGTEYSTVDDPGQDVQAAIDRSFRSRRLADSFR
jgi:hypothetical protein